MFCCSVLQVCCKCVASVVQFGAVFCSVLQSSAVWCSVDQCGAVCCSLLYCVAVWCSGVGGESDEVTCVLLQCVAGVLQFVAV